MPVFQKCSLLAIIFVTFLTFAPQIESGVRYTNLRCFSKNESWTVINMCRLRAKSRDVVTLNVDFDFLRVARSVFVNVAIYKKANGYKPYLYNISIDACIYLHRRNNPVLNLLYIPMRNYTSMNHSCPYTGNQKVVGFNLTPSYLPLPVTSGEYAVFFKCYVAEKKVSFKEAIEVLEFQSYAEVNL